MLGPPVWILSRSNGNGKDYLTLQRVIYTDYWERGVIFLLAVIQIVIAYPANHFVEHLTVNKMMCTTIQQINAVAAQLPRGRMDPHGARGEHEKKREARNLNPRRVRGRDQEALGGGLDAELCPRGRPRRGGRTFLRRPGLLGAFVRQNSKSPFSLSSAGCVWRWQQP